MQFEIHELENSLRKQCLELFNQIIVDGVSYPWDTPLTQADFDDYYKPDESVWCAVDEAGQVLGFAHIHPNGFGRTGHIGNCGYAVAEAVRGKGVGRALVAKSLKIARDMGFKAIQFNAVVSTNIAAIKLYESFGFSIIGTVPGGFRFGSEEKPEYVDRHIMFLAL